MTKLYRCVCGETTDNSTNSTIGWSQLETIDLYFDADTKDFETLHLCPTCSAAVRQIAMDTQDDTEGT